MKTENQNLTLKIIMFSLIIIQSVVDLTIDYSTVMIMVTAKDNAIFDSFNFFYEIFFLPVFFGLSISSIVIMIVLLKRNKKPDWFIIIPNSIILVNFASLFFFSPGLSKLLLFEKRFLIDYSVSIILLAISSLFLCITLFSSKKIKLSSK